MHPIEHLRRSPEVILSDKLNYLLTSCGIDPDTVDPRLLGRGGNHKVYRFKDGIRVVKIPINPHIGTVGSAREESENIALYQQYFPEFSVPTIFLESPAGYCTVVGFVEGKFMTTKDVFEADDVMQGRFTYAGQQLQQIIVANQKLIEDTGKMMDLVGLEGFVGAVRGLYKTSKPPELTNVRIENGRLRIVDYDLVALKRLKGPLERAQAAFAFQLNQQVISRYFKLNYAGER